MNAEVPWADCLDCVAHEIDAGFALGVAVATVALEHGVPTVDMACEYFAQYHARGHTTAGVLT